ncbi:cobalamin biosynthesis family protein [Vibrio sp. S4M6]|uniref:cobalamin biosynthesis family protein n=1 Tax=Vibrio sinus TaxID=2946865 RepID=UPI00202A6465|nr:cobalamin biosynthesis family protein [Vibrio sinus]MCL9781116.1 cobalamin biosynthesis family protein [Vibrio sinus]
MEDFFKHIYSNGTLLIMWGAVLFNFILPIPKNAHPIALWHKFAELLAEKVNNNTNHSQSLISGTLAWALMCLPALAVLIALQPLVWESHLFELALLILALDWRNNDKLAHQLISALAKNDKETAKATLQPFVNRDTATLSQLGLGKASTETLIMGYGRNVIGVLFWYAFLGGIGAFFYRLVAELARAWSPSRQEFVPFGSPAIAVLATLDFIPLRIFAALISIGSRFIKTWQLIRMQSASWPLPGPGWLLIAVGGKLELSLGGPAMYNKRKSVRAKVGGRIAPAAIHLSQVQKLLAWRSLAWVVLQSITLGIIYQGI